jgi:hypothetical protein
VSDSSSSCTDYEQILVINSSNGTSHVYKLKKPKKYNKTAISKRLGNQSNADLHHKVITLVPKTRFKYKSMIKTGAMKIVSMVA